MAGPVLLAADGQQRGRGQRHRIGAQRQRLGHLVGSAEPAGGHELDVVDALVLEELLGPVEADEARHADVVLHVDGRGAGPAAEAVDRDPVGPDLQRGGGVGLDVAGGELHADRRTAGDRADLLQAPLQVVPAS